MSPSAFLKTTIRDAQLLPAFGKYYKIPYFTIFSSFPLTEGKNWIAILRDSEYEGEIFSFYRIVASYPFNTPTVCSSDYPLLINLTVSIFRMSVPIRAGFLK